ncbi:class I SAM-dependent methyltransferase [Streptomyces sp. URMC 123]|uniref:class I SAM-dependent methyltransferase n=1 Tax=Streptomyces sp. URMC 123 TaxID=3423403 RepID=UPI003F1B903C
MPTLPSGGAPRPHRESRHEPHRQRQLAESFGADAERYDRARPRYPRALVDRVVATAPGPDVLDVGCGTGIVARQFAAAGCRVLGVDVDARMAAWARRRGLRVEVAAFETWEPAGREFDAVVSGQSWHWVDPVAGAAKAARVLRPGGRLAVFWNAAQPPPELARSFAEVYRRAMPDALAARIPGTAPASASASESASAADAYGGLCAMAADGIRDVGAFDAPERWRFDRERTRTRDEWLDHLATTGGHAQLPPAARDEVLTAIGEAIDAWGGSFAVRCTTLAVTATRTATPAREG